jgi:tetratricopeptide (TPR) repeat protein
MANIRASILPPATQDDFDRLALKLLQLQWKNPSLQLYGRRGQAQEGVDIFDPTASLPHRAAQCKRYEPLEPLDPNVIEEEVKKALTFKPKLDLYAILATSKQSTQAQQMVKAINVRHSQEGLFKVEFLPWPAIEELLYEFSEVREFIYGPIESSALAKLEAQNRSICAAVEALSAGPTPTEVDAELDNCKALLEAHRHEEAKTFLLRLEQRSWDKLTPRQRFRLKANLGATKLAAGKFEEAGRLYLESKTYQPDDPKALVNEALGHLLTGNLERAVELSSQIRRDFPSETLANIVWVSAAPQSLSVKEIVEQLPGDLFGNVELCVALAARALQERDFAAAIDWCRKAIAINPSNPNAWSLLGKATIMLEVFSTWKGLGVPATLEKSQPARDAEASFGKAISLARDHHNPHIIIESLIDRANIRAGALGDRMGARQDIEEARALDPTSAAVQKQYAEILRIEKYTTAAIEMLRNVAKDHPGPDVTMQLAICLRERNQAGDIEEAAGLFESLALYQDPFPPAVREPAISGVIESRAQLKEWDRAEQFVTGLPSTHLSESLKRYFLAKIALLKGDPSKAVEQALAAVNSLTPESRPDEVRHVAYVLGDLGRLEEAYPLWKRLADTAAWKPDTRNLLQCVSRLGRDKEAMELCATLRLAGEADPGLFEFEIGLLERYHPDGAIVLLRERLQQKPQDKVSRLHLSTIGLRLARPDLVDGSPGALPSVDDATPRIGMAVVRVMKLSNHSMEAVQFAYELFRRHSLDPDAHRAVLMSVSPIGATPDIHIPESVEPGAAVKYVETIGGVPQWIIIEDSANPDPRLGERSPNDALSRELLGKKAGDTFTLARGTVQPRLARIEEITSKYVYRYQDCLGEWQIRFPDLPEVESIRLQKKTDAPGEPEYDLSPLLKSLERRSDTSKQILQGYESQPISIHVLGQAFHKNAFEAVFVLANSGQVQIKCCDGNASEIATAIALLNSGSTIVLDLTAVATLSLLDLTSVLASFPGKFVVSTGTINELREMVATTLQSTGETGYAGKSDEGYYMISETAADRKERGESLRTLIETIEKSCKIVPGLELAAVEKQNREFMIRGFGQYGAESLVIASQAGNLLWTDDMIVAAYGGMRFGTRRVWSQMVLQWLAQAGAIPDTEFFKATAKLVGWRYYFTTISTASLVEAAKLADWQITRRPLTECLEFFGYENADLTALFNLALGFLASVYLDCQIPELRNAITISVIERLWSRTNGKQAVEALIRMIPVRFGLNVVGAQEAQETIAAWLTTQS